MADQFVVLGTINGGATAISADVTNLFGPFVFGSAVISGTVAVLLTANYDRAAPPGFPTPPFLTGAGRFDGPQRLASGSIYQLLACEVAALLANGAAVLSAGSSGNVPVINPALLPVVTGTTQIGAAALSASTGTWTNSPTLFSYQWKNEGAPISGATNQTYAVQPSDLGAYISVAVTATNGAGASLPADSDYRFLLDPVISTTAYYVDSSGTGNDSNAGTSPATAWHTVGKVNGFPFPPGTSILFKRGGVWREQLAPAVSGLPGNPIVFDAYGVGAAPILEGSVSAANGPNWTLISGNLWKSTTAFPPSPIATVTISIANPAVITWTAHGRSNGQAVAFSTSGALPSNITAGVGYYVINATTNTFQISATPGGVAISTLGDTQSGTQSIGANGLPLNDANDVGNMLWTVGGVVTTGTTSPTLVMGQNDANLIAPGQWYFNTTDWKVHTYSTINPASAMTGIELAINKYSVNFSSLSNIIFHNFTSLFSGGTAVLVDTSNNITVRDVATQWTGGGNFDGKNVRYGNGIDITGSSRHITITRCVPYEVYNAGIAIKPGSAIAVQSDITLNNNVIKSCAGAAIEIRTSGASLDRIFIYNNTAYVIQPSFPASWAVGQSWDNTFTVLTNVQFGLLHDDSGGPSPTNYLNINNAYAGLGTSFALQGPPSGYTAWQGTGKMLLDYNLWSRDDGGIPRYSIFGGPSENLTTWAAGDLPAQEVHAQIGVPPVFNAPGHESPGPGSPMLLNGTNLTDSGFVWDYIKRPYPLYGSVTIGAIQNVGGG